MTTPTLIPVVWGDIDLNEGYRGDGLLTTVTNVEGWYGSPPLNGHDLDRALTDGGVFGAKTTAAREITITGAATGPRDLVLTFARGLAARAVAREAVRLLVGEADARLTAEVRADHDGLHHAWHGSRFFEWSVVLTAADPRLYGEYTQTARLSVTSLTATGRAYPLAHPRQYPEAFLPNTARLANPGTAPSPVIAVYTGELSETRLSDGIRFIRVAALADGQTLNLLTDSLVAGAPGGAARASYILAGSQPLMIPPRSEVTWRLTGLGPGSVTLQWRAAWA